MRDSKTNKLINQKLSEPNQNILQKIRTTKWTTENIPITKSESTINNSNLPLIGDDDRTKVIKRNLYMMARREGSLVGLRLIDLGCLEGGISFEMAREDMNVLGVEARKRNYLKCKLIEDYFELPNLKFLHLDVKNINKEAHGIFDIVLCLGLLYHLDNPMKFFNILNQITHDKSLLFLDTHIAPADRESLRCCDHREALSDITQFEYNGKIYEGRWFNEGSGYDQDSDHEWSAISNDRSFWLTQDSLIKALYFNGFKSIYIPYGFLEIEEEFSLREKYSRLYCVALRESYFEQF